ncbi:hypothetical protein D1841_01620 [Neglecta sp. X4]|nr:hypothetical protein [Neglectibacter sp. 59]NBJ72058.1 hypothetical protein [Neglectibacter sp. X4]NCE79834.1 hypothetical protein [Neglectibacter sp. X58]
MKGRGKKKLPSTKFTKSFSICQEERVLGECPNTQFISTVHTYGALPHTPTTPFKKGVDPKTKFKNLSDFLYTLCTLDTPVSWEVSKPCVLYPRHKPHAPKHSL